MSLLFRISRSLSFVLATVLASAGFTPVCAQGESRLLNIPPSSTETTRGGVDMRTGRYMFEDVDFTIGSGDSAFQLKRTVPFGTNLPNSFGNFSHNFDVRLIQTSIVGTPNDRITIHYQGQVVSFETIGSISSYGYQLKSNGPVAALVLQSGNKGQLGAVYRFTAADGTIVVFNGMGAAGCEATSGRCAAAATINRPNGVLLALDYYGNNLWRIHQSNGYGLTFQYAGERISKACGFNYSAVVLPADASCPSGSLEVNYSYTGAGKLQNVQKPDGSNWGFTYPAGNQIGFVKPGSSAPWLINTVHSEQPDLWQHDVVDHQAFADGSTLSYEWFYAPFTTHTPFVPVSGGRMVDNQGGSVSVAYAFPVLPVAESQPGLCTSFPCPPREVDEELNYTYQTTPGPVEIVDENGAVTSAYYCDPAIINNPPPRWTHLCAVLDRQWLQLPQGDRIYFKYDGRGNVTERRRAPRPGAGGAEIVERAAFAISNPATQAKPLWIDDANGQRTTFTYDATHGGVLSELGPTVNGVAPSKKYTYAQRSAWLRTSGSGYTPSASIWLITEERSCRETAMNLTDGSCSGGAGDLVITSYDYGPDAGPNNLWLRGITVTGDGQTLRTCYGYDGYGRRISETSANANLGSCP